ncbi:glycosyltransferase family 2 protein [Ramlibacter rhizophilus]|uniref:glycosyltransferase family 2 protein n=1 Tax=Ramlibacter rhizophilus TaxID=1781167 RepID=UPI00197ED9EF|nr:glycosyltransferase family A protein [Ramlibacter rhizophilus]
MRFSVVIALYNKAPYVRAAVESVLAQRLGDLEVVVVDDGSTDGGVERLADIGDPRLVVVRQANAGVSVARNRGIALARGEWIVFLDADDWQHPEFLARLAAAQARLPGASVVATRYADFTAARPTLEPSESAPLEVIADLPRRWRQGPAFFTGSIAIRAGLLKDMQPCFAPGESCGEDLDLWLRLAEREPVALLHAPLVGHRMDVEGSLTRLHLGFEPPFVVRLRERAESGVLTPAQRRSALAFAAHIDVDLARMALAQGQRALAWRWLARARHGATGLRWWRTLSMLIAPRPPRLAWLRRAMRVDAAGGVASGAAQ